MASFLSNCVACVYFFVLLYVRRKTTFVCILLPFLAVGVFQAVGMGRAALAFAILRKIPLEIPALYVLNRLYPLYAQPAAEFVLSIAAVIMLTRIFNKMQAADRSGGAVSGQTRHNLL